MDRRSGGKEQGALDQPVQKQPSGPDRGRTRAQAKGREEQPLTGPLSCRPATRASTRQVKEASEEQQLAGPVAAKRGRTRHAKCLEEDKQPAVDPAAAHATEGGRTRPATAKQEEQQQLAPKRRRPNPTHTQGTQPQAPPSASPGEDLPGPLALLPGDVLGHVMSLLAAEEGGSCIRSTCSWLRSAFDRCNTRLVLRGTARQLPNSFPARLLHLVRHSPCMNSLTLAESMTCVTWPQVLEAGGPQLLHRLERLTLMHRPPVLDLEVPAACTSLQHLCVDGHLWQQTAVLLHPLAACGGTLRYLEIRECSSVRDFSPLATCAALQHLDLENCDQLKDLAPLAACVQLQQLHLCGSDHLQDLSPLTACVQLQTLHMSFCSMLADLGPLAACVALRELHLNRCDQISDLAPLAHCAALQDLNLGLCQLVEDLGPLAACGGLRKLDLGACAQLSDLNPLASCVTLQHLELHFCRRVVNLGPLAGCIGLQHLNLAGGPGAPGSMRLTPDPGSKPAGREGPRPPGRMCQSADSRPMVV